MVGFLPSDILVLSVPELSCILLGDDFGEKFSIFICDEEFWKLLLNMMILPAALSTSAKVETFFRWLTQIDVRRWAENFEN